MYLQNTPQSTYPYQRSFVLPLRVLQTSWECARRLLERTECQLLKHRRAARSAGFLATKPAAPPPRSGVG
eukprot:1410691-Amphidinium_carterae.1